MLGVVTEILNVTCKDHVKTVKGNNGGLACDSYNGRVCVGTLISDAELGTTSGDRLTIISLGTSIYHGGII